MTFFISFLAVVILFYSFQYFPFTSGAIFLLYLASLIFKKRHLLIPVLVLGVLYAFLRYVPETNFSDIRGKEIIVSGEFSSDAVAASTGKFIQEFHVSSAADEKTGKALKEIEEKDIFVFSDTEFEVPSNSGYEIAVKIGRDNRKFNPGMTENNNLYATLIEVKNLGGGRQSVWTVFEDMRAKLNRHIVENFSDDSGALVSAITTGHRGNMSDGLREAFNSTGLAHVLSISGTHFGIFSVLLFGLFRFVIKFLPYSLLQRITLYVTPSQGAAALSLPFMLAYLALSGWSIPAVRSFIMVGLFLIGLLIGRKRFWLNSLLFAAFVIVLWNPEALFSLSFQLSFLAVLFIGFSTEIGRAEEQQNSRAAEQQISKTTALLRYCSAALRASILLTLAASLGTAPLVAYHFHYFSVISPLSNLLITPLIGFVLLPLSLLSSFIFLFTGHYMFGSLVTIITDITVYLVRFMAGIPFSDIKIPAFPLFAVIIFYAGFVFYFFVSRKKLFPVITSLLMIIYLSAHIFLRGVEMEITYLDVGQGDGAVVELPDKKVVVMDTGRSGREISAFLKYLGREKIDALVLSHADSDHAGGADYLNARFKVKEMWDSGRIIYPEANSTGIVRRILERGDVIVGSESDRQGKDFRIYALHPYKEFYTLHGGGHSEDNNSSLVLRIDGKNKSFLFTGDIEEEAQEDIIHLGKWLKSDVVKVPHHGGRTSVYKPFYDAVSPEIAVISVGRDNSFGHPHQETLEMLEGAKIYRTDMNGAVKITEKNGRLEVKTYRDFRFSKTKTFAGEMENIERLFSVW
ncbi:MAG: DNA internalization-related competence protein ComEC/Rec2 [Thermodesulfovibrionales bacterium]|nr:DNA internalization-related competence protein ComEC/Rec2 [Thermodesulfovibrionales bacterium]